MKEKIESSDKAAKIKKQNDNKLDKCVTAAHAEMARNSDNDEPCDDGR